MELKRIEIPFFDGINSYVEYTLGKPQELRYLENVRSRKIGSLEKRQGYTLFGNSNITPLANYGLFYFSSTNSASTGMFRITDVASTRTIYYLNNSTSNWTALTGAGTSLSAVEFDVSIAESRCFLVNGTDANRYIDTDGTTVVTASTATGHLYNSPPAKKIGYYRDRLYLADYTPSGGTRVKNGVMFSSQPLGIVGLVNGDHASGVTTINVTDTKYVYATDTLQVYRGGTLIETLTVSGKTETTITVSVTSNALKSADEIWVNGTFTGQKIFRWATNPSSGVNVKQYDTFRLSSGNGDQILLFQTVGEVLIMANKNSLAAWNDYNLSIFDSQVGCVSSKGYAVNKGILFFVHYTGVYMTTGGAAPQIISSKVDEYFTGASTAGLEASVVGKKGLSMFFAIGSVTLYNDDGSTLRTLSNVVLEYDIRQQNWYVHTGIPADQLQTYITSTDPDRCIFTNSSDFKTYEFLAGTSDNSAEIPMSATTQNLQLNKQFERFSYPKQVIIEATDGHDIHVFVSLDDGPFFEIQGSAIKGVTILLVTPQSSDSPEAKCHRIKIALKEFSTRSCKVNRIALLYAESQEEDKDLGYPTP